MKRLIASVAAVAALCTAADAFAVPSTTSFTARVSDATGPVDGAVTLRFRIFNAASGGTEMWAETHNDVTADAGLVSVVLGSQPGNGLDSSVFTGNTMYLEITVNSDVMSPRLPILSVPYAVRAATAGRLGTLRPSDVALASHNHDSSYAALSHNHDSSYAALSHNHDSSYAALSHNHDSSYAALSHDHDTRYYPRSTLNTSGTVNASSNPVAWSKLKGVPAGFADGTDNTGVSSVTAGSGLTGGGNGSSVSLSVATGGITSTHLAANSVNSNAIASGAVGASELGNQHNHGFVYDTSGLANGFGYIWPSAGQFTATENAKCYIWARLRTMQSAQSGTLRLQVVATVDNGNPTGGNAIVGVSKAFGESRFTAAAMESRTVQQGKAYKFGCGTNASGDFVGDAAYCYITYICM